MYLFMNRMRIFVENEPRKVLIPILNPILELSQRSFSPCQVWTRAPQTNFPVFFVTRYERINFRAMKFRFSCGAMSMSDLKFRHPDRIFPGTLRTCGRILSRNYSKFLSITIVLGRFFYRTAKTLCSDCDLTILDIDKRFFAFNR